MKRIIIWLAALLLMIQVLLLAGCTSEQKEIDASAVLNELLEQVEFADRLTEVEENAALFFGDLPDGAQVCLFSVSGYYADEVALISVQNEADVDTAMGAIEKHIADSRFQYANYLPAEAYKIDHAVTYRNGLHLFLCVTSDYKTAREIFNHATERHPLDKESMGGDETNVNPTPEASPDNQVETSPEVSPDPTPTPVPMPTPVILTEPTSNLPVYQGDYPMLHSKSGTFHDYGNNVVRVDDRAYELFGFIPSAANQYANLINYTAEVLEGSTKVHTLLIPTAVGVVMPDDIVPQLPHYTNQGEAIDCALNLLSNKVVKVDCFDNLMKHRDEYLYFRTDFHWNGLGAYYAYEAICEAIGVEPVTSNQRREQHFEGFLGAHYWITTGNDPVIGDAVDTVIAFHPRSETASMVFTEKDGTTYRWNIIEDASEWRTDCKYLTFAAGDRPIAVFTNPEVTDGSVAIVVKDSFGNPILPLLVDHYSTIYEIDYRYWDGNLIDLARQTGADDLFYMNCISLICSSYTVGRLSEIIY